jgi:hypothetical protein
LELVPIHRKTYEVRQVALNESWHALEYVPDIIKTKELYMNAVCGGSQKE